MKVDWSRCADAESKPDVMSAVFVVRGTRVPVQAVLDNAADGYTAEQIATEIYHGLPIGTAICLRRPTKIGSNHWETVRRHAQVVVEVCDKTRDGDYAVIPLPKSPRGWRPYPQPAS